MKLQGKLTMLVGRDGATFEVVDATSGVRFLSFEMNTEDYCAALGRQSYITIDMDIRGLDLIGKKKELKPLKLPVNSYELRNDKERLMSLIEPHLVDGWRVWSDGVGVRQDEHGVHNVTLCRYVEV